MRMRRSHVAVLLLALSFTANASQLVRFSSGRASVPLPAAFHAIVKGDSVVATFGADGDHTLALTLLANMSKPGGANNLALDFVRAEGAKRGANVLSDGERTTFSEPGAKETRDGKVFQAMHWQVGVGNCVFVMTLIAPLPMSKELDEFLGDPLNTIVNELSCSAPQ